MMITLLPSLARIRVNDGPALDLTPHRWRFLLALLSSPRWELTRHTELCAFALDSNVSHTMTRVPGGFAVADDVRVIAGRR